MEVAMKSVFRALGLGSVAALALTSALAIAQETAPGSTTPDATTPDATTGSASASGTTSGTAKSGSGWPCEQPERPEMSPAQVWHGPDTASAEETWRQDPAVVALVGQIAPRRMPQNEAIAAVPRFSAGYTKDRATVLTAVFAGLFETMNQERSDIIRGIKHFN